MKEIDLANIRRDYSSHTLSEKNMPADPLAFFSLWLADAMKSEKDPNAFSLATVNAENKPSVRIVLLKKADEHGLQFFTNYESRKAAELAANPSLSLVFFWPNTERQVRVEGICEKCSASDSDEYFAQRPRAAQIGAIVSQQSRVIASREVLEKRFSDAEKELEDKPIQRPENWGGYNVIPKYWEFWQGRASRLHDRLFYKKDAQGWQTGRLSP